MASKLFHAVVGVGISLGSVAACGGSTSNDFEELLPADATPAPDAGIDTGVVPPKLDATTVDATPASDAGADAVPDASVADAAPVDAAPDAPADAIVAAFCDVTWPITKAGREVCGPADECEGKPVPWCYLQTAEGVCTLYPLECKGGEWHCFGGAIPTLDPWSDPQCQ